MKLEIIYCGDKIYMCGIVGVLSNNKSVVNILNDGLHELQNRGYDSIGFSLLNKSFLIQKEVCNHKGDDIDKLFSILDNDNDDYHNGIAHSRWATHGGITHENAHPHICSRGLFALVHNGIIENFKELKGQLLNENKDLVFLSETDTEVIVNMISSTFSRRSPSPETQTLLTKVIAHAICSVAQQLQGTYGLVVQCRLTPNHLYCIRYGSPLVVGIASHYIIIVSEKAAFSDDVNAYFPMEDHDLVILCHDKENPVTRVHGDTIVFIENRPQPMDDKQGYSSWTEKEIMEQPDAIQRCIKNGSRILPDNNGVQLGGLLENKEKIDQTDHLILLGCGTSHHACLLAAHYFRTMKNNIQTVQVCDGSEFHTSIIAKTVSRTTLIVVSQSGETMDLLLAIHRFREHCPDGLVLGIINVVDSIIARSVDGGVYTNSGKERGVASTKSFTSQIISLYLTCCFFSCPPFQLRMIR